MNTDSPNFAAAATEPNRLEPAGLDASGSRLLANSPIGAGRSKKLSFEKPIRLAKSPITEAGQARWGS